MKLMIATPCYGGQVNCEYMRSILGLQKIFDKSGYEMKVVTIPFESLITRARNALFTGFINSDFTHIIFIDSDIIFNPYDVCKLIQRNKGVIAGLYPKKNIIFEKIVENSKMASDMGSLISSSVNYAFSGILKEEDELMQVKYAATGFLLISKQVAQKLVNIFSFQKYINDVRPYSSLCVDNIIYNFFNTTISTDKRFLSEDYSFCDLCSKANIPIYVDKTVKLTHVGQFYYHGDYTKSYNHTNPFRSPESSESSDSSENEFKSEDDVVKGIVDKIIHNVITENMT